jgi:hypothetical protein
VYAATGKIAFLQFILVRASVTLDCATVGLVSLLLGRREWSAKIPFGPSAALSGCVAWYVGLVTP